MRSPARPRRQPLKMRMSHQLPTFDVGASPAGDTQPHRNPVAGREPIALGRLQAGSYKGIGRCRPAHAASFKAIRCPASSGREQRHRQSGLVAAGTE